MKKVFSIQVFAVIISLFAMMNSSGQMIDVGKLKGMKFRSIGPAGMSGRVTSIDAVITNPDVIYVGTASGGLWKSESAGIRWKPVFDQQPIMSIGAVAIDQNNPDVIWAGTGEGNPRNSQSSGAGVYKSLDGGKNWNFMGLEKTKTIHRIIVDKQNSNTIYVAALGSAWGPNSERGVYKTLDGGKTWNKILFVNDETGCADLVVDPTNPNKLLAAMWEYGRKPWTFRSGGKGSGLYVTFNGGETWKKRTDKDGLPKGELGRIGLAISHSKPKIIYALIEAEKLGLYKSTDGGFKWKKVSDKNVGNRPFYYADIYVDPQNENRIYNLWTYTSLSEDGGKSFRTILDYRKGVHPDHHAFWIDPNNPDFIINGNDGGLNISRDRGLNWRFVENLPLGQFYHINIDNELPYNVYGGMQDNGSWRGPSQIWQRGGIRNSHWEELLFGDGFDVVPNPQDNRYGYAMYQGGNLHTYDLVTGRTQYIQPIPKDSVELRFNWNAGIALGSSNECVVYFGSQFLHKSTDCGLSWEVISPDLTSNDTTKQKQALSGGLTIDATQAENFTSIIAIAPSTIKEGVIWVGTDDGNLQLTRDGGKNWTNLIDKLKDVPSGSWIPFIFASKHNEAEAYVIINNYRRNDWEPYVYRTADYGKTWVRLADKTKVNGYALSIVQDPVEEKLLFLGTENGLYVSFDKGLNWNKWGKDYPSVSTMDMKIHPREGDLVIGTFGRAAYILDDIQPLRKIAKEGTSLLDKPFVVFDPPPGYMVSTKSIEGVRFTADAHFKGTNKSTSAKISCFIRDVEKKEEKKEEKKDQKKKDAEKKKDKYEGKVKVEILNESGDTIRVFSLKPDTGMNRFHWNYCRDGVRYVSHGEDKKNADLPSGRKVLPGTYKIVLAYGEYSGTTSIKVRSDPREEVSIEDLKKRALTYDVLQVKIKVLTEAFNRLKEVNKTTEKVNEQLENLEDSVQKNLRKQGGDISKKVDELMDLFIKSKDFVGYDHVSVRLMDRVWTAMDYIKSGSGVPSITTLDYIKRTEKEMQSVLKRVNLFIAKDWTAYQKAVEESNTSLFKEYEELKIED